MTDRQVAHLEMIQGVVNRLSQNSFLLKGWSVVLLAGLFGLAAADSNLVFVYIAYIPTVAFWFLDAYFLRQERLFRALYNEVRTNSDSEVDFSMDTRPVKHKVGKLPQVALSVTIAWFYGVIVATIIFVTIAST